jgi:trans-aconitate methyltransferase
MGVATHLGIDLREYDARIRTFIPDYEDMLDVAAAAVPARSRVIVDLGIGTGALAARCLDAAPRARVVGIDADPEILKLAARRLRARAIFACGTFLRASLPPCDAVVASFALHHIRTRGAKERMYRRIRTALGPRGLFLTVDCHPATDRTTARVQRDAWHSHLRRAYTRSRATGLLKAWSHEDVYVPLEAEVRLIERGGFRVELLWRRGSFAVLQGTPRRQ